MVVPLGGDSSITQQMLYMHWVIALLDPLMVTALSVELGSISLATWIEAPVTSRISLILDPPLPIRDPHCDAGTISLRARVQVWTLSQHSICQRWYAPFCYLCSVFLFYLAFDLIVICYSPIRILQIIFNKRMVLQYDTMCGNTKGIN